MPLAHIIWHARTSATQFCSNKVSYGGDLLRNRRVLVEHNTSCHSCAAREALTIIRMLPRARPGASSSHGRSPAGCSAVPAKPLRCKPLFVVHAAGREDAGSSLKVCWVLCQSLLRDKLQMAHAGVWRAVHHTTRALHLTCGSISILPVLCMVISVMCSTQSTERRRRMLQYVREVEPKAALEEFLIREVRVLGLCKIAFVPWR